MYKLDGEYVNLDDQVYDLINGKGRVVELSNSTVFVHFSNNRRLIFNEKGEYNGVRRLFWHNPIILAPEKNKDSWLGTASIVVGAVNYIKSNQE